jgi:hypothetical protein
METNTMIRGYLVEFEGDDETTQCYINKNGNSASLECLIGTGCLNDRFGGDVPVPQAIIDQIEAWAMAQGY